MRAGLESRIVSKYTQNIILCVAYVVAAFAARTISIPPGNVVAVWPATGIALAGVLLWGTRVMPGVFFGAFFGNFLQPGEGAIWTSFLTSSITGIGECGTVFLAARLLKRFVQDSDPFGNIKSVSLFLGIILVADVVSATLGTFSLYIFNLLSPENYLTTWTTWYVGDTIGMFVFVPLIYCLRQTSFSRISVRAIFSATAVLCVCAGVSAFVLNTQSPLLYLLIPIPVISTFLFGRLAGMLTVVALQLIGILICSKDLAIGPFHQLSFQQVLILIQVLYASLTLINLYFAALLSQLERAVKVRDKFLSIASHELKTPITSVKLRVQIFERRIQKGDAAALEPENIIALLQDLDRQTIALNRLVDEMLEISRIQSGKLSLNYEDCDLCYLVKETMERLMPHLEQLKSNVSFDGCKEAIGRWDPFRIEQVITNLLTNAAKYGRGNPIKVRVWKEHELAKFEVTDSGTGISLEDRSRIFQAFERAVRDNDVSGLGLGLFISKTIVDAHGGTIEVESKIGEGSTFVVSLPLTGPS